MSGLVAETRYDGFHLGARQTVEPKYRYGHGQRSTKAFYHLSGTVRLSWSRGRFDGVSAVWACGARSTRPTLLPEPPRDMPPCPACFDVRPKAGAA